MPPEGKPLASESGARSSPRRLYPVLRRGLADPGADRPIRRRRSRGGPPGLDLGPGWVERLGRPQLRHPLPPPRCKRPDAHIHITRRTNPGEAIVRPAHALAPLRWQQVQKKPESRLWNEYIQRYHYLGHKTLPGAQLRYFVHAGEHPVALLGFGAAAWQTAPRDRYIGWSHEQRKRNLHLIVNNARFLILPWVQSKNLASMILAQAARLLPGHWH